VLQKAGFQRGEYRTGFYQRAYMQENGERWSDLQEFFLLRPAAISSSSGSVPTSSKKIAGVNE